MCYFVLTETGVISHCKAGQLYGTYCSRRGWLGPGLQTAMKIQPFRHTDHSAVMNALGGEMGLRCTAFEQRKKNNMDLVIGALQTSIGE